MALQFEKYHGIGNDFLVVEVNDPAELSVSFAKRLCDRHFGVGGDGVLLVSPARSKGSRATMTVINSDGSIPEMCGNGLRCVALHLSRQGTQLARQEPQLTRQTPQLAQHAQPRVAEFIVDTDAGPLLCKVEDRAEGALVGTQLGRGTSLGELQIQWSEQSFRFHRLSTGNPHAICFREPISSALLDQLGPLLSEKIPGGANVEIATLHSPTEISVTVWERGVGRTLACGTGAAATALEAVRQGKSPSLTPISVHLPGGTLSITVQADGSAYLLGPAAWVYSGSTELPRS